MSLILVEILLVLFTLAIGIFVMGWLILKIAKTISAGILFAFIGIVGIGLFIFAMASFRDAVTSDYRCVDTLDTYQIYQMNFEDNETVVYYIDSNKEIKHIKSDKAKIFYDVAENDNPYVVRNKYWRWFIYWEELEIHTR